jgi:bisphosphoglycerate-independent phosphoglycerate mutase (AlkP superfamily)
MKRNVCLIAIDGWGVKNYLVSIANLELSSFVHFTTHSYFIPLSLVCARVVSLAGIGPCDAGDAIHQAATPVMDGFRAHADGAQWAEVEAHQFAVGLPEGVMGNSEVGHLTIGAGQVQFQVGAHSFSVCAAMCTLPPLCVY